MDSYDWSSGTTPTYGAVSSSLTRHSSSHFEPPARSAPVSMHVYLSVLAPVGFLACPNAVVRGDMTQYTPSSIASLYTQAFGFMHNSSSSCVTLVLCTVFLSFCCTSHLVHHQNLNLSVHVTYSLSTRSAFEGLVIQALIYAAFITLHFLLNFLFRFLSVLFCFHFTFCTFCSTHFSSSKK